MKALSGDAEQVLFLSPEAPYPLAGGGAMRTSALLHYLAGKRPVHLVVFAQDGAPRPEAALPPGLADEVTTIQLPYHRRAGAAKIYRNSSRLLRGRLPLMDRFTEAASYEQVERAIRGRRYGLAVIEHFWCADYVRAVRRCADAVVLDLHNVESALHASCADTEPWPQSLGHRLFGRRARQLERSLLAEFDLVLAASDADAARVRELCPRANVAVCPNSIPLRDAPNVPEREEIAFSGNLEYHPNVSAVRFFATQVWQSLKLERPNLIWRLIGKNPHAVQDVVGSDPRIEFSGEIQDALPEIARAQLVIVPLLAGSGTRVKIMEAWAAARAVVSSPIGAEGLPARAGENIVLASEPRDWLDSVLKLLTDEAERGRLGAAGRKVFERELCWPAAWARLDQALKPYLGSVPIAAAG